MGRRPLRARDMKEKRASTKIDRTCQECSKSFQVYPYRVREGTGKYCSYSCRSKGILKEFPYIMERNTPPPVRYGSEASGWKGGVSTENEKARRSPQFKEWRIGIFERDNYTCQDCNKRGGRLHPHHIKSFSEYKEERVKLENGVTLCYHCHRERHKEDTKIWGSWGARERDKNKELRNGQISTTL